MTSHSLRIIALLAAAGAAIPVTAEAETCTLYQKWKKDAGLGNCSAFPETGYYEVTPAGGTGTFFARKVPKCKDGTDTGCATTEIKSLDGTRPFYFVDPRSNGIEADSRKWVIAFEGGGACGAMWGNNAATACMTGTRANGYPGNGYDITNVAPPDYKEMTSKHAKLTLAGQPIYTIANAMTGKGILDPGGSNTYSTYNRVLVNKSSFDRFMGNTTTAAEPYNGDNIQLFFHGRRIISAMLKDLARANGAFSVGPNCPNFLETQCETVPDFAAASEVVVVGESGGAGGLVHNMEFMKNAILNRAPDAKVVFLLTSRMIPWLEVEVHFTGAGNAYSSVFSGTSTIDGNSAATPDAAATFTQATFQTGGTMRNLVGSWGNAASPTEPFLDAGCLAVHGATDWPCYDEGHVALWHMHEDVFWFESLADSVHNGSSPATFIPTADFGNGPVDLTPFGGFLFRPAGNWNFSIARGSRVVYAADQMLLLHPGAGVLGFYQPALNCHTTIYSSAFWSDKLWKNAANITSLMAAFTSWKDLILAGTPANRAWIEDTLASDPVIWSSGIYGGGWLANSAVCPP